MNRKTIVPLMGLFFVLYMMFGCHSTNSRAAMSTSAQELASPAPSRAFSPRLTAMQDGGVLLSWLEPKNDQIAELRYSVWRSGAWAIPTTIVDAQPFSRHPSESPGVIVLSATNLIAYWSQRPPSEKIPTKEVDVYFAASTDNGGHWTTPNLVNRAGTGVENSYVSAAPVDETHAALIWLDGASWKEHKRVRLMSRTAQVDGSAGEPRVLDPDTCTCCPTSLIHTGSDLVAAYRGHTPENIRDISLLENAQGRWSSPRIPIADHWHFAGCPVNGPQLNGTGSTIVLIWFTASNDHPEVKLAFSHDGGRQFATPVRIDEGAPVGRAQVVLLSQHSAVTFWIEHQASEVRLAGRFVRENGIMDATFDVARGTALGYPSATRAGANVFVTWAEETAASHIHVARLMEIWK